MRFRPLGGFALAAGDARGGRINSVTNLKQLITGPGVESNGLLYIPTGPSSVSAIDLMTQRLVWATDVGGPSASLAVAGGRLLACTADRATCLDPLTGSALWSAPNAAGTVAGPALTDRFACFATPDALHVLDAATGRELHNVPAPGLYGHIAVRGDRAYACAPLPGGKRVVALHAFDLERGTAAWTWEEPTSRTVHADSRWIDVRGPAVDGGIIVFTLEDRMCGVEEATGKRRWVWTMDAGAGSARRQNGRLLEPFDRWQLLGTPAVHDGVVYANWWGTRVSGWDVATGNEVWRYEGTPDRKMLPPDVAPVAGNGLLLCVSAAEDLCALRCDLVPRSPPPPGNVNPTAKAIVVPWAVGAASTVLLVAVIFAVFGVWRFMFSLACLLLCVLTVFAWVRSYQAAEFVGQQTLTSTRPFVAQLRRGVLSRDGSLTFGRTHDVFQSAIRRPLAAPATPLDLCWTREPVTRAADDLPRRNLLHFAWTHRSRPSGTSLGNQSEISVTLPHWLVAALLAIAPLAWLSGLWRDRRRYAAGLCPWCGYDLRESKGRCPECGRAIAPSRRKR
jgi:outer membrane protein assembly factor BamB